jgi:hypothetical protein
VTIDPKDRKLLLGALCVFVLLVAAAVILGGQGVSGGSVPSSYSTSSGGAKAAYLVLSQAGYRLRRWERPLDNLPPNSRRNNDSKAGSGPTLVLAEPSTAPTAEEREAVKTFVSTGGRVIATGMFAGTFLPENDSVPDPFGDMTWMKARAISPSLITRAAPEISMAPQAHWRPFSAAYPLYSDAAQTRVVKYSYGRGEVLWWASATPLTNAGLKESGNLEFLLACMGDTKSEILWDEYIHGYRETLASSIAHSPVKWLVLQLTLLALAIVATFSRRSGPVCQPASDVRLSPIEFVETLGGLYEHAGTASVAVDICYQRFRYWLTRRLGVASNISVDDLQHAVRDRWALADDRFFAVLQRCESAKSDPFLQAPVALHLVQELDDYAARLKLFRGAKVKRERER